MDTRATSALLYLDPAITRLFSTAPALRKLNGDALNFTDQLGISASYLNHLERNQRPVTASLLLKLAELYEVDVRSFAAGGGGRSSGACEPSLREGADASCDDDSRGASGAPNC